MKDRLIERSHAVAHVAPTATPAGLEIPITLKAYDHVTFYLSVDNGNSVTGSTVTLKQGTAVGAAGAMTDEKALSFTTYWANTDTGANDTLTATTASSNTFTTNATNAKNLFYVLEVDADDLDTANNFDCVRIDLTDPVNAIVNVVAVLTNPTYAGRTPPVSAITD